MSSVNIVTSDRGWILERLAREIESRLPYARYGESDDPTADIQYYITYSRRRRRIAPIEVAYFAHLEKDPRTAEQFFSIAADVEHCVCHASLYEKAIRAKGCETVTTISPGVDLERFALKLRVGVVGRTYHTGRKGEHLIAQVMDIPEIEWHFTGEGWPGPARNVPDHELADFYRDMDYILVPSLYEGGPMCVVEALACGREVVASSVGWVDEFPHIGFENGNAADLRRVLLDLIERKRSLRSTVLDRSWDAWAEGHDRLFRDLLVRHGRATPPVAYSLVQPLVADKTSVCRPVLVLHGNEGKSLGGPSVRVPRTARELRNLGMDADLAWSDSADLAPFDLVHAFNVWNPDTALALLHRSRTIDKPLVFSSIYLDLSERPYWDSELPSLIANATDLEALDSSLQANARRLATRRLSLAPQPEPVPGYFAKIREMMGLCDHAIFLSKKEQEFLAAMGAVPKASSIVHNPVDADSFASGDAELFADRYGVRDYVLCVARVEPRKNQWMLVHALRNTGLPIVLIGHAPASEYAELVRRIGGPMVTMIDRIPHDSDLLRSAYAGARVAVLPSWSEGAPLAALEAAASGASLVLSDRSSELEYFGDYARFCDPANPMSIRQAVLAAYHETRSRKRIEGQKDYIRRTYSWARYADATANAYRKASSAFGEESAARHSTTAVIEAASRTAVSTSDISLVFDLTTSANHKGRWTGISRVEIAMARAIKAAAGTRIAYVAWHNKDRRFVSVPSALIESGNLKTWLDNAQIGEARIDPKAFAGASFVVAGSAWMQNTNYAAGAIAFASRLGLKLTPIIYDIIPTKYPFWFNEGYAPVFERNLRSLLVAADRVITISESTRKDLQQFYLQQEGRHLPVDVFRIGDEINMPASVGSEFRSVPTPTNDNLNGLLSSGAGFVLCVGAIHSRKNHRLLYDCWVRLSEKMGQKAPRLAIVGGVAWNGHDVARAFREDRRLKGLVHILEDVADPDLEWLYRNCLFTAYPSLYEGWGLPVAESLQHGKICLAAETSSVPEIAPESTDLLDALDVTAWISRISMYASSPAARSAREQDIKRRFQSRSWSDSAAELVGVFRTPLAGRASKSVYRVGEVVSVNSPLVAARYGRGAWHLPESWGSWTSGRSAGFSLHLGAPPTGDMVLVADCQSLANPDQPLVCIPEINGEPVGRWIVSSGAPGIFCASVPRHLLEDGAAVELTFVNSETAPISSLKAGAKDQRRIGIGVARFALIDVSGQPDLATYFSDSPRFKTMLRPGQSVDLWHDKSYLSLFGKGAMCNGHWGVFSPNQLLTIKPGVLGWEAGLRLRLSIRAVATPLQPQSVTVLVNGQPVDRWDFSDAHVTIRSIALPPDLAPAQIELLGDNSASPYELGLGPEKEAFCVGLVALEVQGASNERLDDLAEYTIDRTVLTTESGDRTPLRQNTNWYAAEETGTWTRGKTGTVQLRLPADVDDDLHLHLDMRRYPTGHPEHDTVELACNGTIIGTMQIGDDWQLDCVRVPRSLLHVNNVNELNLTISASGSPYSPKAGGDARDLGLMLRSFCLSRHRSLPRFNVDPAADAKQKQKERFRLRLPARQLTRWLPLGSRRRKGKPSPVEAREPSGVE